MTVNAHYDDSDGTIMFGACISTVDGAYLNTTAAITLDEAKELRKQLDDAIEAARLDHCREEAAGEVRQNAFAAEDADVQGERFDTGAM